MLAVEKVTSIWMVSSDHLLSGLDPSSLVRNEPTEAVLRTLLLMMPKGLDASQLYTPFLRTLTFRSIVKEQLFCVLGLVSYSLFSLSPVECRLSTA